MPQISCLPTTMSSRKIRLGICRPQSLLAASRAGLLCLLVCLAALFAVATPALADETREEVEPAAGQLVLTLPPASGQQVAGQADGPDATELLDGYAQQRFDAALRGDSLGAQGVGDDTLSGNDSTVYGLLKEQIVEVAAGTRTSTIFEIDPGQLAGKTSFTAADLGVESVLVFDEETQQDVINPDAVSAAYGLVAFDLHTVLSALLADCPYELYWHDKSVGAGISGPGLSTVATPVGDGWEYGLMFTDPIVVSMEVSEGYAAGPYEVDPSTGQRVETAVAAAQQVVASSETVSESPTSYDRLAYFKDRICDLVSYDFEALSEGVAFGDSWQLVSVFDGDETTNVVCEGYSKAFKYLCDLADMTGVSCRLVTGVMGGGTGAGDHMWNIVQMDDGCNYLVDVTNCDEGSVGAPDQLFLVPPSSGSIEDGYVFATDGGEVSYAYDADTRALYSHEKLSLASVAYGGPTEPSHDSVNLAEASVTPPENQLYTGAVLKPAPEVRWQGRLLQEGTDYSLYYTNNLNAGTAKVTITGIGENTGVVTCTFVIEPRSVVLTSASAQKTYDGTDLVARTVTVSGDGLAGPLEPSYTFTGMQHDAGTSENTFAYTLPEYELASNYQVTQVYGTLTVEPRTVTVVPDETFKNVGDDDPELTAHVEGLVEGDTLAYDLVRDPGEELGSYVIHASGEQWQGSYEVLYQDGTFTIEGAADPDKVLGIEFVPVKPYVLTEGMNGYELRKTNIVAKSGMPYYIEHWHAYRAYWHEGDKLIVTYPTGTKTYVYTFFEEEYDYAFVNGTERIYPTISDDQDYENQWTPENPGTVTVSYGSAQTTLPVTVVSRIDHIEYRPVSHATLEEGVNWPSNYETMRFVLRMDCLNHIRQDGDVLALVLLDGSEICYEFAGGTWHTDNESIEKAGIDFVKIGREVEWISGEEGQTREGLTTVDCGGFTCQIPFTLEPNSVLSMEITTVSPVRLRELVDGWYSTERVRDENGKYQTIRYFHYSNPKFRDGDRLTICKRDGSVDEYIYSTKRGFVCGEDVIRTNDLNFNASSNQSATNQWTPDNPGEMTYWMHGVSCTLPVTITSTEIESFTVMPVDGVLKATDDNSVNVPAFVLGDQIIVKMFDGSTKTYTYTGMRNTLFEGALKLQTCFTNVEDWNDIISVSDIDVYYDEETWSDGPLGIRTVTLEYVGITLDVEVEVVEGASHAVVSGDRKTGYTGKGIKPKFDVRIGDKLLVEDVDYYVSLNGRSEGSEYNDIHYDELIDVGTYWVVINGIGLYEGRSMAWFDYMVCEPNPVDVDMQQASLSVGSTTSGAQTVALNLAVTNAYGPVTISNESSDETAKSFIVDADSGTLVIPEGTPAGTYDVTVCVAAEGDETHAAESREVTFQVFVDVKDISEAEVVVSGGQTYTGQKLTPAVKVQWHDQLLRGGADYTVSYANNVNAGSATVIVQGCGAYAGKASATFTIAKAANKLSAKAKAKKVTVKLAKVKKAKVTLASNVKLANKGTGKLTYKNASTKKASKKFKVSSKTGKVTVPKGTKKGTYTVKVRVTATGNANVKAGSKTVTYKVVVK